MSGTDRRKSIRRKAWFTLLTALLAAFAITVAASALHLRWDMTENGMYTLSDSTRGVLDKLDEPVMIRAYITRDLPQPYGQLRRFVADILRSYHEAGHGNVGFEIVDPADDPNVAASLAALKIPKVQVQVIENDQAQVKQGYMAVVAEYLNKKETIPVVRGEQGFEYLLTGKIRRLTGKGRVKIGVVAGFGAKDLVRLRSFKQRASEDYELVMVEPDKKAIDKDIRAVIVAGFNQPPSEAERYALDQFRMSGRGLLILAGNVDPQLSQGFTVKNVEARANAWLIRRRRASTSISGVACWCSTAWWIIPLWLKWKVWMRPIRLRMDCKPCPYPLPLRWHGLATARMAMCCWLHPQWHPSRTGRPMMLILLYP